MLELGGNAADAAVAAGFAIAVVEPTMNSIGGRNQILVRTRDGDFRGIDGTTQAPWNYDEATAPRADYGYAVIGVPGALAGLLKLHDEHGSLPLATVMAPRDRVRATWVSSAPCRRAAPGQRSQPGPGVSRHGRRILQGQRHTPCCRRTPGAAGLREHAPGRSQPAEGTCSTWVRSQRRWRQI